MNAVGAARYRISFLKHMPVNLHHPSEHNIDLATQNLTISTSNGGLECNKKRAVSKQQPRSVQTKQQG